MGGCDKVDKVTSTISAYDERTDSWKAIMDMPTARRRALVAITSEKMMVIGGLGRGGTIFDTVEIGTAL